MKYCMTSKRWKAERVIVLVGAIVLPCAPISMAIYGMFYSDGPSDLIYCIGLFVLAVAIPLFISKSYGRMGRKYHMDENGIAVSYFPKRKRFYPWKAFFGIVVCDFDHSPKYPSNCYLIIRMAAFDEDDGPYSKGPSRTFWGMEKWRGYKYTEKNFDKIVFLGYSPELLEEVCRLSKLPVTYSLTQYGEALMAQNKADGNWDR